MSPLFRETVKYRGPVTQRKLKEVRAKLCLTKAIPAH